MDLWDRDLFYTIFEPRPHPAPLYMEYLQETVSDILGRKDDLPKTIFYKAFLDTINCIDLPDNVSHIEGFFPTSPMDCSHPGKLCSLLTDDMITSLLVSTRHFLKPPTYNMSTLALDHLDPPYDLGNFSRNLNHYLPESLHAILGISHPDTFSSYEISTHYPNLVASMIKNARIGCFSKEVSINSSYMYNKSFFCNCLSDLIRGHSAHPKEALYIFERLFSLAPRFSQMAAGKQSSPDIANLLRFLPNVTTRLSLLEFLTQQLGADTGSIIFYLTLIGAFVFPAWQIAIRYYFQQFEDFSAMQEQVKALEELQTRFATKLTPEDILAQIEAFERSPALSRVEKAYYSQYSTNQSVDWWLSNSEIYKGLFENEHLTQYPLYYDSPLLDEAFFRLWYSPPITTIDDKLPAFNAKELEEDFIAYNVEYFSKYP